MYKAKELRDQSLPELELSYQDSCRKLFALRNQAKMQKKLDKPSDIKNTRKDIARILTVITQKKRQEQHQS